MNNKLVDTIDSVNSQVNYKGSVKIFYMDKYSGKSKMIRQHNTGDKGLLTAICRMLCGLDVTDYVPSYIQAYDGGTQVLGQRITYASAPIPYMGSFIDASNADNIQYTFIIPANSIISSSNTKIDRLTLYNIKGQICAEVKLKEEEQISTVIDSNILIYWKLTFCANANN